MGETDVHAKLHARILTNRKWVWGCDGVCVIKRCCQLLRLYSAGDRWMSMNTRGVILTRKG